MKTFLIGYTGFVGSNLNNQYDFDGLYASDNIKEAYGKNPDLIIYSAVPSKKFIANKNEKEDYKTINKAIENIKNINPKKVILISTIDVYENPIDVDEHTEINPSKEAYGKNRLLLEQWIQENYEDYLIVRLPALYGKNIKKNFIYDMINIIPSMLKEEKYIELIKYNDDIKKYYTRQNNHFYKCIDIVSDTERKQLQNIFIEIGFTALSFTDSRASFQFYNLDNLIKDITIAINNNLKIINLAVEPVTASELYKYIYDKEFNNEITNNIPKYNFKTAYYKLYNGDNGYIYTKDFVMKDIKTAVLQNLIK